MNKKTLLQLKNSIQILLDYGIIDHEEATVHLTNLIALAAQFLEED